MDDVEGDVGDVGDGDGQGRGQLGEEGAQGGNDALVARAVLVLVVFDGVHDGDHHDEVEAVLAEVGGHVAQRQQQELDVEARELHRAGLQQQAGHQHHGIADDGDDHQQVHQLLARGLAGDGRIEDHEEGRDHHAEHLEQREEAALIAVFHIDIGLAQARHDDAVADLLQQEDQGDPQKLVVAGDRGDDLLEADRRHGVVVIVAGLLYAEDREGEEDRAEDRDDEGHAPVGRHRVAADGAAAGGEHRDEGGGQHATDAGEERGAGGVLVAGVGVGAQRGHHAPVGDVMHRVGDGVEEVHDAEEPDEAPALELDVEGQIDDHGGGQDTDDEPGLELAPARARALDDVAHDRVVQRVEHAGGDHDRGDRGKLRGGELVGEEDKGQQIAGDEVIHHISADGADGEHDQVSFDDLLIFHAFHSVSFHNNSILPLIFLFCKRLRPPRGATFFFDKRAEFPV